MKIISDNPGWTDRETGFTLMEILITIVVLSIGLLAVSSMQTAAINGDSSANDVSAGTTWAEDKIENLMRLGYGDTLLSDQDGDGTNQDANSDGVDDAGRSFGLLDTDEDGISGNIDDSDGQETNGNYLIYWNIAEDVLIDDTKIINIIVTWQDAGVQKSVSIQRVIPRIS